jgi:hypothetical protein
MYVLRMQTLRKRRGLAIGLGVALATFAVGVTEADASCYKGRRACRCAPQPAYSFLPPPNGPIPPNPVYGPRWPRDHSRYWPSATRYDYSPPGYGSGRPWFEGASYRPPPRSEYASYPGRRSRPVRLEDYDDEAPPPDYRYRPDGGWNSR